MLDENLGLLFHHRRENHVESERVSASIFIYIGKRHQNRVACKQTFENAKAKSHTQELA